MGTKIITLANILVVQYFVTSHYQTPHRWEWLLFTAVVLGVLLAVWNKASKPQAARLGAPPDGREK